MGLQLILGASGQGKTKYIMDQVIRESMNNPSQRYYILVPEQFSLEMQRQMILNHPNHSYSNIDVVSFYRLAYMIFDECGYQPKDILEDLGVSMILKRILMKHEEELLFFKRSMKLPGFLDQLKSMLMEFMNYGIRSLRLLDIGDKLTKEGHTGLAHKCEELGKIFQWFEEEIADSYMVTGQILDVLKGMVGDSRILQESIFYLDGYTGFTPVQLEFLRELLPKAREIKIAVTIPYLPGGSRKMPQQEVFSFSEKTIYSLWDLCKESGSIWHDPVMFEKETALRYGQNIEMAHMEKYIFREKIKPWEGKTDHIHITACKMPDDEAEYVLHKIEYLVRTKGYRYRDFAIIMGNEEEYPWAFVRKSQTLQIPLFVDSKQKMTYHSGVETIRALFHLVEMDYSYESVFRYLKSGMSDFTGEDTDYLENYVIAAGVRGYSMWKKPFYRRLQKLDDEGVARLEDMRLRLLAETMEFTDCMKSSKTTVKQKMTTLYKTLCQLKFHGKLVSKARKAEAESDFVKAMGYRNFFGQIVDLMDKIVAIFGEEEMSLKEFSEICDAGLESISLASLPLSMDQTILGDLKRTRLPDVKVLFFVGMNDGDMPPVPEDQGIISDEEKRLLDENGITLSLNLTERVLEDEYYMYLAFSKPQDELYFTYCQSATDGSSKRPSSLFHDFNRLFPGLEKRSYPEEEGKYFFKEADARDYLIEQMRKWYEGEETEAAFFPLLAYWNEKHPEEIQKIFTRMDTGITWMPLDKDIVEKMYGQEIAGSVTRMETFSSCPYRYYCDYGLQLKEREEYQIHPVDLGNLFHKALELYSKQVKKEGYQWKNVPEDVEEALIVQSVDQAIGEEIQDVLDSSERNRYKKKMVLRIVKRTVEVLKYHLRNSYFEPDHFELHIGANDHLDSTKMQLSDGHKMSFQGVIDRIDIYEDQDKVYVKIIDYKSGSKKFDFTELYYGLQLQLIMYMNAAIEWYQKNKGKKIEPAGVFYYNIKDPIQNADLAGSDKIWNEFRMSGYVNSDPEVIENMEHGVTSFESISFKRNKDGSPSKASAHFSTEDFHRVGDYVNHSIRKTGEDIYSGEITARPYKYGDKTPCQFCPYISVCGFDERRDGHEYRTIHKKDRNEILERIREEVD